MSVPTSTRYTLADLLYLMQRLRKAETGCPWDLKQNWQSITASTVEEAYEVVEAIESGDRNKIREELGDLLFQVVFYSQFASEEQVFNFYDVVDTLVNKLVTRHPHVFPDGDLRAERDPQASIDENAINKNWEDIKKQERQQRGKAGVLADVATSLPAVMRAEKLQKRAARVGLDWLHSEALLAKMREELAELEAAASEPGKHQAVQEEVGDLLFTAVNIARFFKIDSEQALRAANSKFERRVAWMESKLAEQNKTLAECTPEILDHYWQAAKADGL